MKSRTSEAIWQEKYKRWRIQVQRDGVRKSFYSSTPSRGGKAEAERKAEQWLEEGTVEQKEKMLFEELTEAYLAHIRTANGTAHLKRETCTVDVYLLPRLKGRKVASLTNIDYQEAIDACVEGREKPLSARTCGHVRTTINAIWRYARKAKIRMEQPFDLTIPTGATKGKRTILQPEDVKKLFDPALNSYHYIWHCRFIVLSGLRPGELCGLKTEDLDGNVMTIHRARNRQGEITTGKNENARRSIVLPALALEEIKGHQKDRRKKAIISPWLFCSTTGGPCDEQCVYKSWLRIRDRAGIAAASLYELRHTMISLCKSDVPLSLLKQVVGHSESMDTLGTYGHEVDGEQQTSADMISAVFADLLKRGKK